MELIEHNINVLQGLSARKQKRSPMPDELSGEGAASVAVGATLGKDNGVNFTPTTLTHDDEQHLLHGLRKNLQAILAAVTEATQSPQQITFGFMLGAASVALGYKISSHWKTFTNHPNLNIVVVADSGEGKSGPLDLLFKPIWEAQHEHFEEYKQELREYKSAPTENRPTEKPHRKKYLTDDATIEAIKRDLIFNPNGMGIVKDEGVLDFIGAYKEKGTQTKDDNEFLKMSNCAQIESSRKSDDEDCCASDHSYLCVVGGTQPVNLPLMFGERRILSGMFARFLFIVPPHTKRVEKMQDAQVDLSAWSEAVKLMLGLPPTELTFTDDARQIILDYRNEMEQKRENSDPYVKTIYGKLPVHVLRLSMVLHYLSDNFKSDVITSEEARYTIEVMRYFEKENLRAYDIIKQGKPKQKLGFYQAVHQAWDSLGEHCSLNKVKLPCSKAEFSRIFGIAKQNFNTKVLTAKY